MLRQSQARLRHPTKVRTVPRPTSVGEPKATDAKRPGHEINCLFSKCRPRACGGGPWALTRVSWLRSSSPRMRGWSVRARTALGDREVVPAHAGVVPAAAEYAPICTSRPRACGGGPEYVVVVAPVASSPPRMRGWSPVPGACGCGVAVVPAHAGVVRSGAPGHRPRSRRPRACGGGPWFSSRRLLILWSSPRMRGWSPVSTNYYARTAVVPAHAGVVRRSACSARPRARRPRTRGGCPDTELMSMSGTRSSPHTRGLSVRLLADAPVPGVVPAHAGGVPEMAVRYERLLRSSPRTRG
jgi:hypothetical protein